MITKTDVKSLGKSFVYAFRGIAYCVNNERNMRIHLSAVVLLSFFSYFYGLSKEEYLVLFLCFGLVIAAEVFNTSMEALVNLESPAYHHYARIAKDVAAGGVAVCAIAAAIVGVLLYFTEPKRVLDAFVSIYTAPFSGIVFSLLVGLSVLFIFCGPRLYGRKSPDARDLSNFEETDEDKTIE